MDKLITPVGAGAGSGILGAFLTWLGLKAKDKDTDRRIRNLEKGVRYADTCIEMNEAVKNRLSNIEKMNEEMRLDIKELLKR